MADTFAQRVSGNVANADTIVSTDGLMPIAVKSGTTWVPLELTSGDLPVVFSNTTIAVTATALDIRALIYSTDNIAIKGATGNQLVINSDGSINVVTATAAPDSIYLSGSATLVKDTEGTVVTVSPGADAYYGAVMVSGAGYCEWNVKFGTTGAEATILKFWTTPSHPTEYVDLPDYLKVTSTQTLLIRGTNREKSASTGSDFTG